MYTTTVTDRNVSKGEFLNVKQILSLLLVSGHIQFLTSSWQNEEEGENSIILFDHLQVGTIP